MKQSPYTKMLIEREKAEQKKNFAFYKQDSIWGNFNKNSNYMFYIISATRQTGKTYMFHEHWMKDWWKCHDNILYYYRLTDKQKEKLLSNNAEKMFDPPLVRKYFTNRGYVLKTHGDSVYAHKTYKDKDGNIYVSNKNKYKIVEAGALSTFASDKGIATFDFEFLKNNPKHRYWVFVDEFQKEIGERSQGDIAYQFVSSIQSKFRNTSKRIRVMMACNNIQECSEILSGCFNFLPINYGVYKLKRKKAIIHFYKPPESYHKMTRRGISQYIMNSDDANFIDNFKLDLSLIAKKRTIKPTYIIRFGKSDNDCFIVWDDRVIQKFEIKRRKKVKNKDGKTITKEIERKLPNIRNIPMVRFTDEIFNKDWQKNIFDMFDQRFFLYKSLIDKTRFESYIKKIRPNK